jgi:hypothetical protein
LTTDADAYQRLTRALDAHRGDAEAYRRLGAQMTARRHLLGPRYGNRRQFVRERLLPLGLKETAAYKLVYDLERGELQGRAGFSAGNMLALADAYGTTPDEVITVLDGGDLEPPQPPVSADALLEALSDDSLLKLGPVMAEKIGKLLPDLAGRAVSAPVANPGIDVPTGAQMFGPGAHAEMWDDVLALGKRLGLLGLLGPDGFDLPQAIKTMAITMLRADEHQANSDGKAAS